MEPIKICTYFYLCNPWKIVNISCTNQQYKLIGAAVSSDFYWQCYKVYHGFSQKISNCLYFTYFTDVRDCYFKTGPISIATYGATISGSKFCIGKQSNIYSLNQLQQSSNRLKGPGLKPFATKRSTNVTTKQDHQMHLANLISSYSVEL